MLGRFMVAVAGLAATVALAGCGGSSSSNQTATFKKGYSATIGQLKQTSTAIGEAIQSAGSQTDAQIVTKFRSLASDWQSHLSQLETLKPPSKLAADFNTLTSAATRVEGDLNAIVAAGETHSKSAGEQAGATIVTDILAARNADMTLKQKLGLK